MLPSDGPNGRPWGSGLVGLIAMLRRRAVPSRWSFLLGAISCGLPGGADRHRSLPDDLLHALEHRRPLSGPLPAAPRGRDVGGVRIDDADLLRGPWWAADAAGAPLGGLAAPGGPAAPDPRSPSSPVAFRKPRRWQWVLLFGIFVTTLLAGWSGYALPDDMLAGTGLRIFQGVVLGIPLIGTALSMLIFGGEFPGTRSRQSVPDPRDRRAGRSGAARSAPPSPRVEGPAAPVPRPRPDRGQRRRPAGVADDGDQVGRHVHDHGRGDRPQRRDWSRSAPIWRQGPSSPGAAGAGSQPDWYTAFLDGALRLVPPGWELMVFDRTWTLAVIVPLIAVTVFFVAVARLPLRRAVDHRRPCGPPPARPTPRHARPDRDRRRRDGVLRHALGRGECGSDRHPVPD